MDYTTKLLPYFVTYSHYNLYKSLRYIYSSFENCQEFQNAYFNLLTTHSSTTEDPYSESHSMQPQFMRNLALTLCACTRVKTALTIALLCSAKGHIWQHDMEADKTLYMGLAPRIRTQKALSHISKTQISNEESNSVTDCLPVC